MGSCRFPSNLSRSLKKTCPFRVQVSPTPTVIQSSLSRPSLIRLYTTLHARQLLIFHIQFFGLRLQFSHCRIGRLYPPLLAHIFLRGRQNSNFGWDRTSSQRNAFNSSHETRVVIDGLLRLFDQFSGCADRDMLYRAYRNGEMITRAFLLTDAC